jgi:hypothetical protein
MRDREERYGGEISRGERTPTRVEKRYSKKIRTNFSTRVMKIQEDR